MNAPERARAGGQARAADGGGESMTMGASRGRALAPSLYLTVLGARLEGVPPSAQRLHSRAGRHVYRGKAEVERGRGWLSRLCAWATRLPRAGHGPIKVEIIAGDGRERWTRLFAGHAMRSRLWARDGLLCERLGLVTFGFHLDVEETGGLGRAIVWRVARVRALGMPLPASWFDGVRAREYERDGRYRFDVAAALPLAGRLVHYRGWLDVD